MCVDRVRNVQRLSLERANEVAVKNKKAIELYSELHAKAASRVSQALEPLLGMHATKVSTDMLIGTSTRTLYYT